MKPRLSEVIDPMTDERMVAGTLTATQQRSSGVVTSSGSGAAGQAQADAVTGGGGGLDDIDDGPLHGSGSEAADPDAPAETKAGVSPSHEGGGSAVCSAAASAAGGVVVSGGEGSRVLKVWTDVPQVRDNLTRTEFTFGEWVGLATHLSATTAFGRRTCHLSCCSDASVVTMRMFI